MEKKSIQCLLRLPTAVSACEGSDLSSEGHCAAWLRPFQEFRNAILIYSLIKQLYSVSLKVYSPIYRISVLYSFVSVNTYKSLLSFPAAFQTELR